MAYSLYLHIPFCEKKCFYCDFYSVAGADKSAVKNVIQEIINEAEYFADQGFFEGVKTVYIGGGTPSVLPPDELEKLLNHISETLRLSKAKILEWPRQIRNRDAQLLSLLEGGITRISAGIQTMDSRLLSILGRAGSRESNIKALDILEHWKGN